MGKWKYILRCVIGAAIGGTLMIAMKINVQAEKNIIPGEVQP